VRKLSGTLLKDNLIGFCTVVYIYFVFYLARLVYKPKISILISIQIYSCSTCYNK